MVSNWSFLRAFKLLGFYPRGGLALFGLLSGLTSLNLPYAQSGQEKGRTIELYREPFLINQAFPKKFSKKTIHTTKVHLHQKKGSDPVSFKVPHNSILTPVYPISSILLARLKDNNWQYINDKNDKTCDSDHLPNYSTVPGYVQKLGPVVYSNFVEEQNWYDHSQRKLVEKKEIIKFDPRHFIPSNMNLKGTPKRLLMLTKGSKSRLQIPASYKASLSKYLENGSKAKGGWLSANLDGLVYQFSRNDLGKVRYEVHCEAPKIYGETDEVGEQRRKATTSAYIRLLDEHYNYPLKANRYINYLNLENDKCMESYSREVRIEKDKFFKEYNERVSAIRVMEKSCSLYPMIRLVKREFDFSKVSSDHDPESEMSTVENSPSSISKTKIIAMASPEFSSRYIRSTYFSTSQTDNELANASQNLAASTMLVEKQFYFLLRAIGGDEKFFTGATYDSKGNQVFALTTPNSYASYQYTEPKERMWGDNKNLKRTGYDQQGSRSLTNPYSACMFNHFKREHLRKILNGSYWRFNFNYLHSKEITKDRNDYSVFVKKINQCMIENYADQLGDLANEGLISSIVKKQVKEGSELIDFHFKSKDVIERLLDIFEVPGNVCSKYVVWTGLQLQLGDINFAETLDDHYGEHTSHKNGYCVDVRPLKKRRLSSDFRSGFDYQSDERNVQYFGDESHQRLKQEIDSYARNGVYEVTWKSKGGSNDGELNLNRSEMSDEEKIENYYQISKELFEAGEMNEGLINHLQWSLSGRFAAIDYETTNELINTLSDFGVRRGSIIFVTNLSVKKKLRANGYPVIHTLSKSSSVNDKHKNHVHFCFDPAAAYAQIKRNIRAIQNGKEQDSLGRPLMTMDLLTNTVQCLGVAHQADQTGNFLDEVREKAGKLLESTSSELTSK